MNSLDSPNFKINNTTEDPSSIDYDILGLHKKRNIIRGELKQVNYYRNYEMSSNTYSNLTVIEVRDYIRDAIGLVQYRNQHNYWICEDESTGMTKTTVKYYSPTESIDEGIFRRGNMIGAAKIVLLNELKAAFGEPTNQTYAFDLLLSIKTQMDYFNQGYTQPLRDAISGSTKAYLTESTKIKIIDELTF